MRLGVADAGGGAGGHGGDVVTDARERALAAIARADATIRVPAPETVAEWAARAPDDPHAIARWIREAPAREEPTGEDATPKFGGRAPVREEPPRPPEPAPPPASSGEIAALKAKVASLETKLTIATSRKGQAARRRGRGYLAADYGGRDA